MSLLSRPLQETLLTRQTQLAAAFSSINGEKYLHFTYIYI